MADVERGRLPAGVSVIIIFSGLDLRERFKLPFVS